MRGLEQCSRHRHSGLSWLICLMDIFITPIHYRPSLLSSALGIIPRKQPSNRIYVWWGCITFKLFNSSSLCVIPQALNYEEDNYKRPSLSHPNLCPLWLMSLSTEAIPVVVMPWFGNGNVLDFIRQNPVVNKLGLVCLFCVIAWIYSHIFPGAASC